MIGSNNVAEATATSSMTLGDTNVTKMPNSLTFGQGNINNGENSFVGGDKSKAVGRDTFAFGSSAESLVDYTVAIGSQARTNAFDTIAIGNGAYVSGESSVVLGRTNNVTGADSVGYGNYKGSNAVAVGVFAHPNENTLLSLGATFGTGDNMINAGATFRVGKSYKQVTNSNVAVAKDVQDLAKKYEALAQKYDNLVKSLNRTNGTDYDVMFPDVPSGHWAYDFVKDLSDKGYLVGYPDGTFKGDKAMNRYEFATALYRALQNGAVMDANMVKAIKEFKPELKDVEDAQRFVIKHESGSDNEIHKVE